MDDDPEGEPSILEEVVGRILRVNAFEDLLGRLLEGREMADRARHAVVVVHRQDQPFMQTYFEGSPESVLEDGDKLICRIEPRV